MFANTLTLGNTERPRHLVSRKEEMAKIRHVIAAPGEECRLVLLEGHGGLGKTRILEEILRRLGHNAMRMFYGPPRAEDNRAILGRVIAFGDLGGFMMMVTSPGTRLRYNGINVVLPSPIASLVRGLV